MDHADLYLGEAWYYHITPDAWCDKIGVLPETILTCLRAVKHTVAGRNKIHFFLAVVEKTTGILAGYVRGKMGDDPTRLSMAYVKFDREHPLHSRRMERGGRCEEDGTRLPQV